LRAPGRWKIIDLVDAGDSPTRLDGPEAAEPANDIEQELVTALESGAFVDRTTPRSRQRGRSGAPERTVDAELLYRLVAVDRKELAPARALKLRGARIRGRLDLDACEVHCPVVLERCYFEQAPVLDEARVPALRMPGCHLPGLSAWQLETHGNLELDRGFASQGGSSWSARTSVAA